MEWYNIVITIVGLIGGAGGFLSLYTAKAKKDSMEIDNFKKMFDEAQEERSSIRRQHTEYMEQTDRKIERLEGKIDYMEKRNAIKMRAINSAYRCKLPQKTLDCPVLKTLNQEEDKDVNESRGNKLNI